MRKGKFSNSGGMGGSWLKYFPNKKLGQDFCCPFRFKRILKMSFGKCTLANPQHSIVYRDKKMKYLKLELDKIQAFIHLMELEEKDKDTRRTSQLRRLTMECVNWNSHS